MVVNAFKRPSQAGETSQPLLTDEAWHRIGLEFALSRRELDVVRQIFGDQKEAAIAEELGISPHTVHTYVARAYQKLKVASRLQLVVRIVEKQSALATRPSSRRQNPPNRVS